MRHYKVGNAAVLGDRQGVVVLYALNEHHLVEHQGTKPWLMLRRKINGLIKEKKFSNQVPFF